MPTSGRPQVMDNAHEDLLATVEGRFSPADWEKILSLAETKFCQARQFSENDLEAWKGVILDFHKNIFWNFKPDYRAPKQIKKKNMGIQLVWITFNSFCTIKVLILWFGQIYSRSDNPVDKWIFFFVLAAALANIAFFLWRNRSYVD